VLVVGQIISHYRVLEQIGAGGMGVVYRARDERLDRDVALKVLPPHSLTDPSIRKRFRAEALTLSKLNHPNIAIIFDFDTEGDTDFLVTEYVPGVTLDTKLARAGMPEAEVRRIGLQLASGLEAAHRQGIVHLDLKPANLRLTPDGLLKILDFGLARLLPHASNMGMTETLSKSFEVSGTLPYMSPEQLRGEGPDVRSDIWATGAVFYEMTTGKRAFPEEQPALLVNAILNSQPKSAHELNRELSSGFEVIVLKALEKDAVRRYQSAQELRIDLERLEAGMKPSARRQDAKQKLVTWAGFAVLLLALLIGGILWRRRMTSSGVTPRRTVAVLGFKNLSGKSTDAWISTALSEMLTTELGANGKLRTISGENVARMKADLSLPDSESLGHDTLQKVDQMLGTDLVVLGSYLIIGDEIRVDLRVQDTSTGEVVATAPEQGTEAQFFDLVKRAGEALRQNCGAGELSPEQRVATDAAEPASTEAVRLYSEGLAKLREFDFLAARDLLQKAIAADPNSSLSHSALAAAWSQLGYDDKAKSEAKRAFEMSANLPRKDKLSIEAGYREQSHEWDKAVDLYHSLWTFFPDDLGYGLHLANAQTAAGKGQEAFATIQALRALPARLRDDPRIDMAEAAAAEAVSDYKREQVATTQVIDKAGRQGARLLVAQAVLQQCWALRNMGDLAGASAAGQRARETLASAGDLRGEAKSLTCIANVLADQGNLAEALKMYETALGLARTIGGQKDIAGALINIGNVLAVQQNLEESTRRYKEALAVALEIDDKPDALLARNNIGANLIVECDFKQARSVLEDALQTSREIGDELSMINTLTNLGVVFLDQGEFDQGRKSLQESLDKARQLDLKSSVAYNLVSMGDADLAQGDLANAEKNYHESLTIRTALGQRGDIASSQLSIAGLRLEMDRPGEAADLARQAADEFHAEKIGDEEALAGIVAAQALLMQNKLPEAKAQLEQARKITTHDKSILLNLAITTARLAAATGAPQKALSQLKEIIVQAHSIALPGYEFQARLAQADAQRSLKSYGEARETLQRLEKDSAQAGFLLVSRKAERAQKKLQN
jgi:tetratricopeptide (TPR) repeat protein/tRNA A-37 threonylcarbamoyl transferase component Bud32